MSEAEHPFDAATDNDERINEMLAETGGKIAAMEYTGTIGYHIHVAEGETDPEYLWKIALLQALDESVFEMMYVDADSATEARNQIESELERSFDSMTAGYVADVFEEKLAELIRTQEGGE